MFGKKTEDRRVKRTRATLRSALVSLIVEKGYDSVTVQDIIDRANVGRSTFYAHFRDKEDLLRSGFGELRAELISRNAEPPGGRLLSFSLGVFEHAYGHRHVYKAMVGRETIAVVQRQLQRLFSELVRNDLKAFAPNAEREPAFDLLVHYAVGALLATVTWWLDQNARETPQEIDKLFRQLTIPGIRAALHGTDRLRNCTNEPRMNTNARK